MSTFGQQTTKRHTNNLFNYYWSMKGPIQILIPSIIVISFQLNYAKLGVKLTIFPFGQTKYLNGLQIQFGNI